MGLSGMSLTPKQMLAQVQTTLAIQIIYYFVINAIKISILLFYLRIGKIPTASCETEVNKFPAAVKRFEILIKSTIYFLSIFCIICVICCLAQCVPLHKMWDFTGAVEGTCINTTALFYCKLSGSIQYHRPDVTQLQAQSISFWISGY